MKIKQKQTSMYMDRSKLRLTSIFASITMMCTVASSASALTVSVIGTRTVGRISTNSHALAHDGNDGPESDKWFFSRPKDEIQQISEKAPTVSADELAVDEYLKFLDRRYR